MTEVMTGRNNRDLLIAGGITLAGGAILSYLIHTGSERFADETDRLSVAAEEAAEKDGFTGSEVNAKWMHTSVAGTWDHTVDVNIPFGDGLCELQAEATMVKDDDGRLVDLKDYTFEQGDVRAVIQNSEDLATINALGSTICSAASINN